jgi:hypothetical protein
VGDVARLIARIKGDVKATANKGGRPPKLTQSLGKFSDRHDRSLDAILGRYAGVGKDTARKIREMVEAIERDPEKFDCLQADLDGANHPSPAPWTRCARTAVDQLQRIKTEPTIPCAVDPLRWLAP